MPLFRSIVVEQEDDATWWYYAQSANTLPALESQTTYNSISRVLKSGWNASRANNNIRTITDNYSGNSIEVVSYQQSGAGVTPLTAAKKVAGAITPVKKKPAKKPKASLSASVKGKRKSKSK